MFARLAGACVIPVSVGFLLVGETVFVRPAASAAPVARLDALADQMNDVVDVATRGRSFGGGARSFSGGRSFSGARSVRAGRSFGGRSFSRGPRTISRVRSFHGARAIGPTRSLRGARTVRGSRSLQGARAISGRRGPGGLTSTRRQGLTSGTAFGRGPGLVRGPGSLVRRPGHGPGRVAGVARIHNRPVHVFRDRRWTWWGGSWRVWAPIVALAGIYVGNDYLWPDAYVGVAQPACVGVTDDGCTLRWQSVPFEEGGAGMQCVQFCPRPGVAPPPAAAGATAQPLTPLPAVSPPAGPCELTIFSDRNFAGMSAPTSDDQPRLGDVGWKNEIASLRIKSGTWDFYSEDDYNGDSMRLPPGQYDNLGDKWTKRVGSFTCVR